MSVCRVRVSDPRRIVSDIPALTHGLFLGPTPRDHQGLGPMAGPTFFIFPPGPISPDSETHTSSLCVSLRVRMPEARPTGPIYHNGPNGCLVRAGPHVESWPRARKPLVNAAPLSQPRTLCAASTGRESPPSPRGGPPQRHSHKRLPGAADWLRRSPRAGLEGPRENRQRRQAGGALKRRRRGGGKERNRAEEEPPEDRH